MYLLAFDLSSSTLGYAIFDKENENLIEIAYYKYPKKCEDLLEKGNYLEKYISQLLYRYNNKIDEVVIEERLKKFQSGKSSTSVILTLAQLNYICQYLMKYIYKVNVTEINVLKGRGMVFPEIFKTTRLEKIQQKDFIFQRVQGILGSDIFPKKIMNRGKNKGKEIFLEEGKDMADAWVIGKAYFIYKKKKR